MSRVSRRSWVLLLTLSLTAGACASSSGDPGAVLSPDTTTVAGEYTGRSFAGTTPAPEFPDGLEWLNVPGPLSLSALRGKIVLLDFWTYC